MHRRIFQHVADPVFRVRRVHRHERSARLLDTDDGSGVVITVARYFTPSGECIHGVGIAPDVEVSLESNYEGLTPDKIPAGADVQLDKALELVRAAMGEAADAA